MHRKAKRGFGCSRLNAVVSDACSGVFQLRLETNDFIESRRDLLPQHRKPGYTSLVQEHSADSNRNMTEAAGAKASERYTREMNERQLFAASNGYLVDAANPAKGDPRQLRLVRLALTGERAIFGAVQPSAFQPHLLGKVYSP